VGVEIAELDRAQLVQVHGGRVGGGVRLVNKSGAQGLP